MISSENKSILIIIGTQARGQDQTHQRNGIGRQPHKGEGIIEYKVRTTVVDANFPTFGGGKCSFPQPVIWLAPLHRS